MTKTLDQQLLEYPTKYLVINMIHVPSKEINPEWILHWMISPHFGIWERQDLLFTEKRFTVTHLLTGANFCFDRTMLFEDAVQYIKALEKFEEFWETDRVDFFESEAKKKSKTYNEVYAIMRAHNP